MVGREMRIPHRHGQVRVAEASLQHVDVSAVHHEVRSKGMAQDVRELTVLKRDARSLDGVAEGRIGVGKQALTVSALSWCC